MPQFDEVFSRITAATGAKTQAQLAEMLEIRQSSISDAKRRNSIPAEWYLKLFKQFGLNPDWLEAGVGPWRLKNAAGEYVTSDGPAPAAVMRTPGALAYDRCVTVPILVASGEVVSRLCIPEAMNKPGLSVLRVTSSSMEPIILKWAFVGIDTTHTHVESGELYAVNTAEGIIVRNVFYDPEPRHYILQGKNSKDFVQSAPAEKSTILGRVVWVLQEL